MQSQPRELSPARFVSHRPNREKSPSENARGPGLKIGDLSSPSDRDKAFVSERSERFWTILDRNFCVVPFIFPWFPFLASVLRARKTEREREKAAIFLKYIILAATVYISNDADPHRHFSNSDRGR